MSGDNGLIGPRDDRVSDVDNPSLAVAAAYDRLASRWDEWAEDVNPDLRATYLERLEARLPAGSDVLELGSGTGRPVGARLALAHRYVGVDSSSGMVDAARQNVPRGGFRVADMTAIGFPTRSFDAVVAFYSIIHVPRDAQPALFRRIRSWLRHGGHFVACLSAGDLPKGWEGNWLGGGPMYWSGFDAETNRRLLREAGFQLDSSEVHKQMEGDVEVRFLWVDAHRPHQDQPLIHLDPDEWLGCTVSVVVDRPIGSTHPTEGFTYQCNYGYVHGTIAGDGEEIDAYLVGSHEPVLKAEGVVVAVVCRRDDLEDKLIVAPQAKKEWTTEGLRQAVDFQERFFDSEIITADPPLSN